MGNIGRQLAIVSICFVSHIKIYFVILFSLCDSSFPINFIFIF